MEVFMKKQKQKQKKNAISHICHSSREQQKGKSLGQGGEEKASYFGPNVCILWEIHLYALLASTNEFRAFSWLYISSRPSENVQKIYCFSFSMVVYKRHHKADSAFQDLRTWIILKRSLFCRLDLTQWYKIIPAGALERPNPLRIGFKREKKETEDTQFKKKKEKKIPPSNI